MAFSEAHVLRKAGDLVEARKAALRALEADRTSLTNRREFAWLIDAELKQMLEGGGSKGWSAPRLPSEVLRRVRELIAVNLPAGELVVGVVARRLLKLPGGDEALLALVASVGLAGFAAGFRAPTARAEGGMFDPLVVHVALRAGRAASRDAVPGALREKALGFVEEVIAEGRAVAMGSWLAYRRAVLLCALGRGQEAIPLLLPVLRAKRREYWAWNAFGLALADEPAKAFAAHARAWILCPDDAFRVGIDELLAKHAVTLGRFEIARFAVTHALAVPKAQERQTRQALEAFTEAAWFAGAPVLTGDAAASLLAQVADGAKALLDEDAAPHPASFLERFTSRKGVAMASLSLANGPRTRQTAVPARLLPEGVVAPGTPLTAWAVRDGNEPRVVRVTPRPDGEAFDALARRAGVVDHVNHAKRLTAIYLPGDDFLPLHHDRFPGAAALAPGTGVQVFVTKREKDLSTRWFTHGFRAARVPASEWIAAARGVVTVTASGHGRLSDVFVPRQLLPACPPDTVVTLLAVRSLARRGQRGGWRALARLPDPE